MKIETADRSLTFSRRDVFRWLYVGRLTLVSGILVGALLAWGSAQPEQTFTATLLFVLSLILTAGSWWHTHVRGGEGGRNFAYLQVIYDALLVTAIVHVTGGAGSEFQPLYILVISVGALLLPLPGGVLVGALVSMVYFAEVAWGHEAAVSGGVAVQMALFAVVAIVTGWVGDRLRRAGVALGEVETELRQLRLSTGDILANLSTGVLTVDASGRLLYLNPSGERLLGVSARQWMGAPVLDAVDEAAPGVGSILRRSCEERRSIERKKATLTRTGREHIVGVSTTVVERGEDEAPSITALFQDITDMERLAVLNRRTERLEAVAELSASLAHEIKNPLASIRSAVEQLTRGRLGAEDRDLLRGLVVKESERLSRLLSEFIDFSVLRMERREDVDFPALVRDTVSLVRQHPDADGGVEVEVRAPGSPLLLPGDSDLLHRAVFNLVLNAVQFAGDRGRVGVEVKDCAGEENPRGTGIPVPVRLVVEDTGPGIPPEDVGRIFDPFFTTRKGGSGLGLAVVHRAVEAHEGALFVERSPEGGARIVLYLAGREERRPAGAPVRQRAERGVGGGVG